MARLRDADIDVRPGPTGALTVRIKGKTHVVEAADLLEISNVLGNAAVDQLKDRRHLPAIQHIHLKGFDDTGQALLRIQYSAGAVTATIDHNWLNALAAAADAALEFSIPGGRG